MLIFLSTSLSVKWVGEVSPIQQFSTTTTQVIKVKKELPPIFKKIAWCESKNIQLNLDGTVHRGVQNSKDVGKYQINEYYHLEASRGLGIDIYTLEGNTEYAYILFKANGTRDWNWSKWCWDDQTVSTSTWNKRFLDN